MICQQCFKAHTGVRGQSSTYTSKGCITDESFTALMCSSAYRRQATDDSVKAAYVVQCCVGHLCNEGDFPALPDNIGESQGCLVTK